MQRYTLELLRLATFAAAVAVVTEAPCVLTVSAPLFVDTTIGCWCRMACWDCCCCAWPVVTTSVPPPPVLFSNMLVS
uniref:Putative secreted protein n=1 Tax=Anopheles marajoara TaxID=58244 RepID=A0A2M4CCK0_9DIPT